MDDHPQPPAADQPTSAPGTVASIPVPRRLADEDALFLLRVHGGSMIDARIADGDWAVVRPRPVARNGEIVAAVLDQVVTVKRFKRVGKQIWLTPDNPGYIPIPANDATILGQVVAVLRGS